MMEDETREWSFNGDSEAVAAAALSDVSWLLCGLLRLFFG